MSILPKDQSCLLGIRRFISELAYTTQSYRDWGALRISGSELPLSILKSHFEFLHTKFRTLNQRVRELEPSPFDGIFRIWRRLAVAVDQSDAKGVEEMHEQLKTIFSADKERLKDFSDTDLIIYKDRSLETLPICGITETDFQKCLATYRDFQELIDLGDISPPLRLQILKDIRKIMSVPVGRMLIERIIASPRKKKRLKITLGKDFGLSPYVGRPSLLTYCPSIRITTFAKLPIGLKSYLAPSYLSLAHELIHFLHFVEFDEEHGENRDLLPELDEDTEEFRTIYESLCCTAHDQPHPCSENSFRRELDLPPRQYHLNGFSPKDPLDNLFADSVAFGAYGDAIEAFDSGISTKALEESFPYLPIQIIKIMRESAQKKVDSNSSRFHQEDSFSKKRKSTS